MLTNQGKKKIIQILCIIGLVLACSTGSAVAAIKLEPINAFFNWGVSFVLNGERWEPADPTGKPIAAIHYKGSNYLPVRALAEALKIGIDFDGETQTIYIGNKPGAKTAMFAMPMEIDQIYVVHSKDRSDTYIKDKQYQGVLKVDQYGDVYFTLDRKFKRLVLDVAVIPPGEYDVEFSLYNAGESAGNAADVVLEKHLVSPEDDVKTIVFDVEGLEKIKIHVQSPNLNPYIYARILDTSYFDNEPYRQ